jgi:hypothetical protein
MFTDFVPCASGEPNNFFTFSNFEHLNASDFEKIGVALIVFEKSNLMDLPSAFGKYKNHFKNIAIYNCGALTSYEHIDQIILFLKSKGVVPFFLGIGLDQVSNYAINHSKNIYHLSNQISYTNTNVASISQNYVGYQRHLCEYDDILEIEAYHPNSMSLGKIRTYGYLTEPILRDCNLLHFESNVLRSSDCPENPDCLPTGMNAEEVCQIFRYLGTSTDLDAIFVSDLNMTLRSAHLMAEAFWYFAEGFNIRMKDHPADNKDIAEFVVDTNEGEELTFVKNNQTQRWWLKTQSDESTQYFACALEEYQSCIQNEIPERLQHFLL